MSEMDWIKSSYSNGNGGNNCVEVRPAGIGVEVRDSKDGPLGCRLLFTRAEWEAFLAGIKAGEFDDI